MLTQKIFSQFVKVILVTVGLLTYLLMMDTAFPVISAAPIPDPNTKTLQFSANQLGGIGTFNYVQENGRRVEGQLSSGTAAVTVTLKAEDGTIKSWRAVYPGDCEQCIHDDASYTVLFAQTIVASDTVEVHPMGGEPSVIFVDPLTAALDTMGDTISGQGPAGVELEVEFFGGEMGGHYTQTVTTDAAGYYTVTQLYDYDGNLQAVDMKPGDYGYVRYTHADGNQVYLLFGQLVYVLENSNHVWGYAGANSVEVSVTLKSGTGAVKAVAQGWAAEWDLGQFDVRFYAEGSDPMLEGDPVLIAGGDTVDVVVNGITTTVDAVSLAAYAVTSTDVVTGTGPANARLRVMLESDQYGEREQWVTTDGAGLYATEIFTYVDDMMWPPVTRALDIQPGDGGYVDYVNAEGNVVRSAYGASSAQVQENGRRVEGQLSAGTTAVTVTLKAGDGTVKAWRTVYAGGCEQCIHDDASYTMLFAETIVAGDTVEVQPLGGEPSVIFVAPLTAALDTMGDTISGQGPSGVELEVEFFGGEMGGHYTQTVTTDAAGYYIVTQLYDYDGNLQAVDMKPGDYGYVRYTHADGNQVYLLFGQLVYVLENSNHVWGYAGANSVEVSVTLKSGTGAVKSVAQGWAAEWDLGQFDVRFYAEGSDPMLEGDPVLIAGGDTVDVVVNNNTSTVFVEKLTAAPNLATDRINGTGPANTRLRVTLDSDQYGEREQWVTTDGAGLYATEVFTYVDDMMWPPVTRALDIQPGDGGYVDYVNTEGNVVRIAYNATGVATTIAAGGLRAGAAAVMGTAVPGATVEIWDITDDVLIGSGTADSDARFAISISPSLIYGHTIVAIANELPSVGHVVQRAVTIRGPAVSVSNTVGFYGIAPAGSTVVLYESGVATGLVTVTATAGGQWNVVTLLANGTHTITAVASITGKADQVSDPLVVIVDPTAVSIGGSSSTVDGTNHDSDASGQNHFPVIGGVQPITVTVEVWNNPCTVTISFMGQTITPTAGTTGNPQITYTVVFTDYEWSWGTHEVVVTAISCNGTSVSQPVAEVTLIDPSGYIYDALEGPDVRVQGATVTCYYSDTTKNEWVVWEAALYNNQINPQITGANGRYGFMVPEGYYYVQATRPGYKSNRSQVYYIPPEVTDAHIPLTPTTSLSVTLVPNQHRLALPGEVITYAHSLTNTGNTTDTFDLTISPGWGQLMTPTSIKLGREASASVVISVAVPTEALSDTKNVTFITATSQTESDIFAVVSDLTIVGHAPAVALAPDRKSNSGQDQVVTYTHMLTNTGNGSDSFALAAASSQGWKVELGGLYPSKTAYLPWRMDVGMTATVMVSITVPANSGVVTDITTLTATSQANGMVYAVVTDTTTIADVCTEVQEVQINGPTTALSGTGLTLSATYTPANATDVSLLWDNGEVGASTSYTWTVSGEKTVVVTATAACGSPITDVHTVTVSATATRYVYLPLVLRHP